MNDHAHYVLDDEQSRGFAADIAEYLRHIAETVADDEPGSRTELDATLPGVGAFAVVMTPGFEGLDPDTGKQVQVPRMLVPSFRWDPAGGADWQASYFAQWLAARDPNAVDRVSLLAQRIAQALEPGAEVTIHMYGVGIFMVDRIGGAFSLSPELLHQLNEGGPFAPDDRDLRIPSWLADGMNDNDLCAAAIDHLWHSLPPTPILVDKLFAGRVSRGQVFTFATSWLCRDIAQGGFAQFFESPSGDMALVALEGLECIGATAYAEILRQAIAVFAGGYPASSPERAAYIAQHDGVADKLDGYGRQFWDMLSREQDLERYMAAFIRNNPEQFLRAA